MNKVPSGETLLRTKENKQNTQSKKLVFFAELLFLVCALSALTFFTYSRNKHEIAVSVDPNLEEAKAQAITIGQRWLDAYKSEAIPLVSTMQKDLLTETNSTKVIPTGVIVVTGNKVNGEDVTTQLFTVNLTDTLDILSPFSIAPSLTAMAEFKDIQNPTDFFFLGSSEYSLANESDKSGIHLYTPQNKSIIPFINTDSVMERSFDWSSTAKLLAFNRITKDVKSYVDILPLENWEVVILDPISQGILKAIPNAYQPKWSPDGTKLVYLKADGLYIYDYKTEVEKKIGTVTAGIKVLSMSMIDLSPDGKTIIWIAGRSGVITLKRIMSWETLEVVDIGQIKIPGTEFYGPQFSPDGQFYVLQAIDTLKNGDAERQNPRLEIRSIKAKEVVKSIPLNGFNFDAFFTDDWVAKMPVK